jgi:hypothetical protein
MPLIHVIMRGGLVQEVDGIPAYFTIRVIDFDVEGTDSESVEVQPNGEKAVVLDFTAPPAPPPKITRNTALLQEIISIIQNLLEYPAITLDKLEQYYRDDCLMVFGDLEFVKNATTDLGFNLSEEESIQVLDRIAKEAWIGITTEHVSTAVAALFPNRLITPEN